MKFAKLTKRALTSSSKYIKYRLNGKKLDYPPQIDNIELTNHCGLNCSGCPRNLMKREKGYMNEKTFKRAISQIKENTNTKFISLHHFGDPVLHPKIDEFSKIASSRDIDTLISTKGSSLEGKRLRGVLNSNISIVKFSWAGLSKEEFERFQEPISYQKTVKNVKKYIKRKPGRQTVKIELLLYKKRPKKDVEKFVKKWKPIVDEVDIKRCSHWTGNSKKIKNLINRSGNKFTKFLAKTFFPPCPFPFESLSILYDGSVVPCCRDYDGRYIIGNIHKRDLDSLWNSEKMKKLRKLHLKGSRKKLELCKKCTKTLISI
ncbi:hypothetical protein C9439_03845 [archaeon SCG-AAA382B04]|nr:hypothetical protein C9439_03845 [archaeon SCG-AAA382B04]